MNDDLSRALASLTIFRVWAAAHRDGAVLEPCPATDRDDQYKSPFREDGKNGSFSICHQGHGFKDFGGDGVSGGAWKFASLCWPNLEKKLLAKKLIELSGIAITARAAPSTASPGVDPLIARAAKSIERRDRARASEDAVYEKREENLRAPNAKPATPWPPFIRDHFNEGITFLEKNPEKIAELTEARGWPVDWGHDLCTQGLISRPLERWADFGEKYAKRQNAFLVQAPQFSSQGTKLYAAGYHQRFYEPARAGRAENKGWLYLPSLPKNVPKSRLEIELERYGGQLGIEKAERRALVPPLPFVLGDIQHPKLIVILEGQWDAITFFGAYGWFHETADVRDVAVFGIRGAQGTDAFLAHWGPWLERVRPRAWVIADNDAAGGAWREAPKAEPGLPRPPSLSHRLEKAGCRSPLVSWLRPGSWGKDFNDYYRAAKPDRPKMLTWMMKLGMIDSHGALA